MIDPVSVSGALAALRATVDLAKGAIDAGSAIKLNEAKAALIDRVLDVQSVCMELQEQNSTLLQDKHTLANEKRELEKQIADLREETDRLSDYELLEPYRGTFVFGWKHVEGSNVPMHYACPTCAENRGVISRLQEGSTEAFAVCRECKTVYRVAEYDPARQEERRRNSFHGG